MGKKFELVHTWTSSNKYSQIDGTYRLLIKGEPYQHEEFLVQKRHEDELGDPFWTTIATWRSYNNNDCVAYTALVNALRQLKEGH